MGKIEDLAGTITLPNLEDNIPDRVTKKELREALDAYAQADQEWKDLFKRRSLAEKEDAGDHLYRLAKALLRNNGFYSYRDALLDSMGNDAAPSPKPEDFE